MSHPFCHKALPEKSTVNSSYFCVAGLKTLVSTQPGIVYTLWCFRVW